MKKNANTKKEKENEDEKIELNLDKPWKKFIAAMIIGTVIGAATAWIIFTIGGIL